MKYSYRIRDIFVGVDVFGRGCYGGGGFACNKAVNEIVSERKGKTLSIAIFAPGWTHETKPKINSLDVKDNFAEGSFSHREYMFWSLLENFLLSISFSLFRMKRICCVHKSSWPVRPILPCKHFQFLITKNMIHHLWIEETETWKVDKVATSRSRSVSHSVSQCVFNKYFFPSISLYKFSL